MAATPAPAPVTTTSSARLQRASYPYSGRLTVLQSGVTQTFDPFAGLSSLVQINFPSMPEAFELSRVVDYLVNVNMVAPDGFHQYKATQPLNIPFEFTLHALDKEYCPNGALSLLQVAALLQSFTVPIAGKNTNKNLHATVNQASPATPPMGNNDSLVSRSQQSDTNYSLTPESGSNFAPPVTLRLDLMFVDADKPGIVCVGYMKDVKCRFKAPFLRGPNRSYNLPSSCDFAFTFVHAPGYGNNFNLASNTPQQQATFTGAFADDIRQKLYNTIDLLKNTDTGFTGYNQQ
jgi:hypothetical protein